MSKYIVLVFTLILQVQVRAQVINKMITYENPDGAKVSSQELTEQALRRMSEDLIVEFIGTESFNKHKAVLLNKVVSQANKFTPFQKVSSIERGEFGARVSVEFRINLIDFRKLLSDAGVFSKERLSQDIIAFFSLEDENGEKIAQSWALNDGQSESVSLQVWHDEFKNIFEKAGYSFNKNLNPQWLQLFKPHTTVEDIMARNTNTKSLLLWGVGQLKKDLRTREPILQVQVRVYSQELKKEVTDSVRKLNLKDQWQQKWADWAKDLVSQIDEVDARALTQGSGIILSIRGPVQLIEQESIKGWILGSSPLIKSATERQIAQNKLSYEIETTTSLPDLAQKFSQLNFKGKKTKVSQSENEISIEVQP